MRDLTEVERDAAMKRNAIYRDALRLLAEHGCERSTANKRYCIDNYIRDADYSAFAWCDACIATDALERGRNVT